MNKKYPRVLVAIDTVFGKEKEIKDLSTDELLDLFEKILQRKDVKWVDAKIYFKNGRQLGFDESKR